MKPSEAAKFVQNYRIRKLGTINPPRHHRIQVSFERPNPLNPASVIHPSASSTGLSFHCGIHIDYHWLRLSLKYNFFPS